MGGQSVVFLKKILGWITGGALDRVLDTVDRKIGAETDREAIKGEIIREHYRSRSAFMEAGGFWLMMVFALPLGLWFAAVCVYSVFWCAGCAFPQDWTIAALPPPIGAPADGSYQGWAGVIITSIFGVVGITRLAGSRRK